ncbi:hypothetical protein NQ798_14550 [Acinetobacter baumannii]|nr:hypothetical protein [Acinetobacter baumannii]
MSLFLNHLCDEEHWQPWRRYRGRFLNHLCDEEHVIATEDNDIQFLNHLCDEQRNTFPKYQKT